MGRFFSHVGLQIHWILLKLNKKSLFYRTINFRCSLIFSSCFLREKNLKIEVNMSTSSRILSEYKSFASSCGAPNYKCLLFAPVGLQIDLILHWSSEETFFYHTLVFGIFWPFFIVIFAKELRKSSYFQPLWQYLSIGRLFPHLRPQNAWILDSFWRKSFSNTQYFYVAVEHFSELFFCERILKAELFEYFGSFSKFQVFLWQPVFINLL